MPQSLSSITVPRGFRAAGGTCGIKASGKPDLAMIVSDAPAKLAAVFTRNAVVGAPVIVGRRNVKGGRGRAIVCNSGCSNVATGEQGIEDALNMCRAAGEAVGCNPRDVLPMSTGVIGHRLPIDKILAGIVDLAGRLDRGPAADADAARAILTTDLRPKAALRKVRLPGATVHIGGIGKGSGMIAPNMATMLGIITTDGDVSVPLLRRALRQAVNADASFNRITVDTDTSTSDTVAVLANGQAGNRPIRKADSAYAAFAEALTEVCRDLAYQVISDGEGVNHVIRVRVAGAATGKDAARVARAVADSPLVKTAVHGHDPNWGRIAAAAGRSGARVDPVKMTITIGGVTVFKAGEPARFDEAVVSARMNKPEVLIAVDLGLGRGSGEILGCDLSRDYIAINADYTT